MPCRGALPTLESCTEAATDAAWDMWPPGGVVMPVIIACGYAVGYAGVRSGERGGKNVVKKGRCVDVLVLPYFLSIPQARS